MSDKDKQISVCIPTRKNTQEKVCVNVVEELSILGCMVDGTGSAWIQLYHRLAVAEKAYWTKAQLCRGRSKRIDKAKA